MFGSQLIGANPELTHRLFVDTISCGEERVNKAVADDLAQGPEDWVLVQSARLGDKMAFAQLFRRHQRPAEGLCDRVLHDRELARDAVQEAGVVAWLSLDRLMRADRFGAWFCGIALNKSRQALRTSLSEKRLLASLTPESPHTASPEQFVESAELSTRVRAAVDGLPQGQREAVYSFYLSGLTHREASIELGITVNAVKDRLHKARSSLSRALIDLRPNREDRVTPTTDFVPMEIADVRMSKEDASPRTGLVLLQSSSGDQHLVILIGVSEVTALALSLENTEMPRPMTYQLTERLLSASGGRLLEVRLTGLVDDTYLATTIVDTPTGLHEVDARPSDALNLAVITHAPITADPSILYQLEDVAWLENLLRSTEIVQKVHDLYEQLGRKKRPRPGRQLD